MRVGASHDRDEAIEAFWDFWRPDRRRYRQEEQVLLKKFEVHAPPERIAAEAAIKTAKDSTLVWMDDTMTSTVDLLRGLAKRAARHGWVGNIPPKARTAE